jgi:hypothetical protein
MTISLPLGTSLIDSEKKPGGNGRQTAVPPGVEEIALVIRSILRCGFVAACISIDAKATRRCAPRQPRNAGG